MTNGGGVVEGLLGWLTQPALPGLLPGANRAELAWLALSAAGLPLSLWNLRDALAAWRWRRRCAPRRRLLGWIAAGHVVKAGVFVGVDVLCLVIGVAAVANWHAYPLLLVVGLLLIRLLLPAVALNDLRLRQRVFALGRSTAAAPPLHNEQEQP